MNKQRLLIYFRNYYWAFFNKQSDKVRKKGELISDFDLLIGSTSIEHELIMVTENIKEFSRISDIIVENWIKR